MDTITKGNEKRKTAERWGKKILERKAYGEGKRTYIVICTGPTLPRRNELLKELNWRKGVMCAGIIY